MPFLEDNSEDFVVSLWKLLVSAQSNESGIPTEFLKKKKEEIRAKKAESEKIKDKITQKLKEESANSTEASTANISNTTNIKSDSNNNNNGAHSHNNDNHANNTTTNSSQLLAERVEQPKVSTENISIDSKQANNEPIKKEKEKESAKDDRIKTYKDRFSK